MSSYTVGPGQSGTHTLDNGDSETVLNGGTAEDTVIYSGGTLTVSSGGNASGTIFSGGGQENLSGTDTGATGGNAFQIIGNGGSAISANLTQFSFQLVASGGVAIDTTLEGFTDGNTTFLNTQEIDTGGVASNTNLVGDTVENIFGGVAVNTIASGDGNEINDRGELVYSGVNAQVSASVFDDGLIVVTGAATRVEFSAGQSFFGSFTGAAVIGPSAELELKASDALGSGTILFAPGENGSGSDGVLTLDDGTSPTETIGSFFEGDSIIITGETLSGEVEIGSGTVTLFYVGGASETLLIDGAVEGDIGVFQENGNVVISSYENYTVSVGDGDETDEPGTADKYVVTSGGTLLVNSAGSATDGYVFSGILDVQDGGTAAGNYVQGGTETVEQGGVSQNDTVYYGGTQDVQTGASSLDPQFQGGNLVDDGMVAYGTTGSSPMSATINTLSGSGTVEQAGSGVVTFTGDASNFTGSVELAGGTVELGGNASLGGGASIDFVAGDDPTLQIDAPLNNLPTNTISGFESALDIIDLRGVGYSANTTSTPFSSYESTAFVTSGGTVELAVTSGGITYDLNLDPGTTGSGPVNIYDDGSGGTDFQFSTLSIGTGADLEAFITSSYNLSNGTYTGFLTSDITLTSDGGGTATLDGFVASNNDTLILDGAGFSIDAGDGGDAALDMANGTFEVTSLGGSIGLSTGYNTYLTVANDTYTGSSRINPVTTLEVATDGGAGTGGIYFTSGGSGSEQLTIDLAAQPGDGGTFSNTINDFSASPQQYIDLAGFAFSSGVTSATVQDGTLTVTNGATTYDFTLGGNFGQTFNTFDDANGGTIVTTDAVPCYCPGTLILTNRGEVAVQDLMIGDLVCTVFAGLQPIRWIGRRSYAGRFIAGQLLMLPVCIKADALEPGVPSHDLHVSPGHAIYIDGVLVPAWRLVNGVSITQAEAVDEVSYLHIELAEHDIIQANGCPAESFFDAAGCRHQFQNVAEFKSLYPSLSAETQIMCAQRVEEGFHLQAIQRRLATRAGRAAEACLPGVLRGYVDNAGPEIVSGWAQDEAHPEQPVCLDVLLDGRRIMRVLANQFRADLRAAGLGSGTHAFEVRLPPLSTGSLAVRRSHDGVRLALTDDAKTKMAA